MTREQAINYLISVGLTQDQVGDVVRALTYKPRDCANCKHYVVTDTRTNWVSQETTKIYGCECWECEYEPTTKNDCEHCSKTYGTLGCCDFVSNEPVYSCKEGHEEYARGIRKLGTTTKNNLGVEEVTALAEWTEKLTKASEDAYNKGYEDGMKAQEPFKPMVEIDLYSFIKQKYIERDVLDKIRAEIETKYGHCDICEYFEDYDYEENDISEYRPVGNIADILQILDKYKAESEIEDGNDD